MGLFDKILNKKEEPIKSYEDFWNWFQKNERAFFEVVRNKGDIHKEFLDKIQQKLDEIQKEVFYFLTGMADKNTVELIFSAEGVIKNIVFIEELVAVAPKIEGWIFTTLKPELDIKNVNIEMSDYTFGRDNISFYSNDDSNFPDEINLTFVHNDYTDGIKDTIRAGIFILLDNFLGELNSVTIIDSMEVLGRNDVKKELIPIEKLKSYLLSRQKEFVEKYDGARYDTQKDEYTIMEAHHESGNRSIATINAVLINWERKASHPWMAIVEMKYDGTNNNGMPNEKTYQLYNKIEEEIMGELKDFDGYLNIGRETGLNVRRIYFACKDFRKPSKVLHERAKKYGFDFDIFKDKYWRSVSHFAKK